MGGATTEIRPAATDRRRASRRRTSTRRRSPARARRHKLPSEAVTPVRARRSTRSCRRSRPSGSPRCWSSTAAARSRPGVTDVGAAPARRAGADGAGPARPGGRRGVPARAPRRGASARSAARSSWRGRRRARPGRRDPAVLAARPGRARRPGRGGAAAGGLRRRSRPCCPPRPPGRGLTPAQRRRRAVSARAGRGGLRRGAAVPVRRAGHVGRVRAAPPTTPAATPCAVRNPLDADRAELRHHAAAGPARHARAQPVARRSATSRCTRWARSSCRTASSSRCPSRASTGARRTPRSRRSTPRCPPSPCTSAWCWPATGSRAAGGGAGGRRAGPTPCEAARLVGAGRARGAADHRGRQPAVAPRPVRHAAGRRLPGRLRGRAAPEGDRRARAAAAHLRDGAGPRPPAARSTTGRCRGCRRTRRSRWTSRWSPQATVPAAALDRRPARRRRRPAGGRAPVRRLRRRAGRRGQPVAGVHAALPRPGPHAHQRGGQRGPRRRGRRGGPAARRAPALSRPRAAQRSSARGDLGRAAVHVPGVRGERRRRPSWATSSEARRGPRCTGSRSAGTPAASRPGTGLPLGADPQGPPARPARRSPRPRACGIARSASRAARGPGPAASNARGGRASARRPGEPARRARASPIGDRAVIGPGERLRPCSHGRRLARGAGRCGAVTSGVSATEGTSCSRIQTAGLSAGELGNDPRSGRPRGGERVGRRSSEGTLDVVGRVVRARQARVTREPDLGRAISARRLGQHRGGGGRRVVGAVVLADAEDREPDLVGERGLLDDLAQPLRGPHRRRVPAPRRRTCRHRAPRQCRPIRTISRSGVSGR